MGDVEYRDAAKGTLEVGVFDDAGERVIRVAGELDLSTAASLQAELESAVGQSERGVLVDLSDLEFIDSTGIAVLVTAMGTSNGSGGLRFVPSRAEAVNRVLAMTGVSERMELAEGIS